MVWCIVRCVSLNNKAHTEKLKDSNNIVKDLLTFYFTSRATFHGMYLFRIMALHNFLPIVGLRNVCLFTISWFPSALFCLQYVLWMSHFLGPHFSLCVLKISTDLKTSSLITCSAHGILNIILYNHISLVSYLFFISEETDQHSLQYRWINIT